MKLRYVLRVVILLSFLSFGFPFQSALANQNGQSPGPVYIVQPGDYLSDIAFRFGVTLDALIQANGIADPDLVKPGDRLIIPGLEGIDGVLVTESVPFGESLRSLSRKHNIPSNVLARLNRLSSPMELYAGSTLVIPQQENAPTYEHGGGLLAGESLLEYAVVHGENLWNLMAFNNLSSAWEAMPGDVFLEPGTSAQEPGALPVGIDSIGVNPIPFTQGKTAVIRIIAQDGTSLGGTFADRKLNFVKGKKNDYYALQGIHAMQDPGLYPLAIRGLLPDSSPFEFTQLVPVQDGGYIYDLPLTVPVETIDPTVTKPEDALWASLAAPVTEKRFWDGVFLMPSPLEKEYCLKTGGCWSSRFGSRRSYNGSPYQYFHTGLDFYGGTGTQIFAPAAGRVVFSDLLTVRGLATMIDHGWGVYSAYLHQSESMVKAGDFVEAGQVIGLVGGTGRVAGPHLHWEIIVNGVQVDPLDWLNSVYP